MSDILYERPLSHGPLVRVRRTSVEGATPFRAVLEVDRRGADVQADRRAGLPPALLEIEGVSESNVLGKLLAYAMEDAEVAKLMRDQGLR